MDLAKTHPITPDSSPATSSYRFAAGRLAQNSENSGVGSWQGVERVLRYLEVTQSLGRMYTSSVSDGQLKAYSDTDWSNCVETRKSTRRYVLEVNGAAVSWCSCKQTEVAATSCEAKYIATIDIWKEAVWLRRPLTDVLNLRCDATIAVACDNDGTVLRIRKESIARQNKVIDVAF